MRAILLAGGIAMAFTLLVTPGFIWLFRKLRWGQFIREDGPKAHHTKHGTPTMGGVVIICAAVLGYFVGKLANFETPTVSALLVLLMLVGLGLVGFIDDFIKTHKQRSLGLTGWAKIALQGVVATVFAILAFGVFSTGLGKTCFFRYRWASLATSSGPPPASARKTRTSCCASAP